MTAPQQKDKKKVGPMVIAALAILACAAFGGWMIWSNFFQSHDEVAVIGADDPPAKHRGDERKALWMADRMNAPDGIQTNPRNGTSSIKVGKFQMWVGWVGKPKVGAPWFALEPINRDDLMTQDQLNVLIMRSRILKDKAVADYMQLTPADVKKLKQVGGSAGMTVTPEEQKSLQAQWQTYETSQGDAKKQAEKALITSVSEIAQKSFEPSKQAIADRVAQIKAALTPEQIELFQKMGR